MESPRLPREKQDCPPEDLERDDMSRSDQEYETQEEQGRKLRSQQGPATLQSALAQREPLTPEEERTLFLRWKFLNFRREALESTHQYAEGSRKVCVKVWELDRELEIVRNEILESHLRLLVSLVNRIVPSSQDFDDFVSEGSMVLMHAIEKFDLSRGFRFSTFATHILQRHLSRYAGFRQQLQQREISDTLINDQAPETESINERSEDLDDPTVTKMILDQVHTLLDERERQIVMARFGLGSDNKGQSFQTIGDQLELSKERTRLIYLEAIEKLGKAVRPHFE